MSHRVYLSNLDTCLATKKSVVEVFQQFGFAAVSERHVHLIRQGKQIAGQHCSAFVTVNSEEEIQAAVEGLDQQYIPCLSAKFISAQKAIPRVKTLSTLLPMSLAQPQQSAASSASGGNTIKDDKWEEDSEAPAVHPHLAHLLAVKQEEKHQKQSSQENHEEYPAVHPHVAHLLKVKQEQKDKSKSSKQGPLPLQDEGRDLKPWARRELKRKQLEI